MTSDAPYHDHPRAFVDRVAQVLGGRRVDAAHVRGSVNSEDDRFLNQLFLHATPLGAPVYAAAGYAEGPRIPLLVR